MSLVHVGGVNVEGSFPRVSGDEPTGKQAIADVYEFSPRERG